MKYHELKTWPEHFQPILEGKKIFEIRKNDRDFQIGDALLLKEFVPCKDCSGTKRVWSSGDMDECGCKPPHGRYTGRICWRKIVYITDFQQPEKQIVMSIVPCHHETPTEQSPANYRCVLQDWVQELTYMQQSVLIAAVRGPDTIRKDHPVKVLCRWLRRCILISAFDGKPLLDPYAPGGGSFTGPCKTEVVRGLDSAVELYLRSVDEIPHHFSLHLMHAAEIIGYKMPLTLKLDDAPPFPPRTTIRAWWHEFYLKIVNDAHLQPESEERMDKRLGDNERNWRAAEEVTAK